MTRHFHYHPENPARHRWVICPDSDLDCPLPLPNDPDHAPAHGIKRPLVVNQEIVDSCFHCDGLWTADLIDINGLCPECAMLDD
jgi:hypothetical protein